MPKQVGAAAPISEDDVLTAIKMGMLMAKAEISIKDWEPTGTRVEVNHPAGCVFAWMDTPEAAEYIAQVINEEVTND